MSVFLTIKLILYDPCNRLAAAGIFHVCREVFPITASYLTPNKSLFHKAFTVAQSASATLYELIHEDSQRKTSSEKNVILLLIININNNLLLCEQWGIWRELMLSI